MVPRVIVQAVVPVDPVLVDQEAHQLGHGDGGVGVVELDRHLVGQRREVGMTGEVAPEDVLQAGRGEEVLLLQPQFLAGLGRVVGVEDAGDALRQRLLLRPRACSRRG